jgi:hypothetical protein
LYGRKTSEGIGRIVAASAGSAGAGAVKTDVAVGGVVPGVAGERAAGTAAATSTMTPMKLTVGAVGTTTTCAVEGTCWVQSILASRAFQTGSRDWTRASKSLWR